MKKSFSLLVISFCLAFVASAQSVTIGTQVWMTKDLDVSTFLNGDPIPEASSAQEWILAGEKKQPAWCYYDNRKDEYGKLYNWYAVNDPRGLAPFGYHVPSNAEWAVLINFLGGEYVAGKKMKSTSGWVQSGAAYNQTTNEYRILNGNGTDEVGFAGVPSGRRHSSGKFSLNREYGYRWSSTEFNLDYAWSVALFYNMDWAERYFYSKSRGMYVRCIKDKFID